MVSDKIKKFIIDKLYKDLSNVEIIPHEGSIWFIDRDAKHWYFELTIKGQLWWRYTFFSNFFSLFSMERDDYELILGEWVEEVLNCKVLTTDSDIRGCNLMVEEVLNCKVLSTNGNGGSCAGKVEEVLNCKVLTTNSFELPIPTLVEEILNSKVLGTNSFEFPLHLLVEEILNRKVLTIQGQELIDGNKMEEVLNYKVV